MTGQRVRGRGRRDLSVADGWRTGPSVDKGARWDADEVGAGRARACSRKARAARRRLRDLSALPHELRLHRGAGGAARDGARVPRRALVARSACARAMESERGFDAERLAADRRRARLDRRSRPRGVRRARARRRSSWCALHGGDGRGAALRAVLRDGLPRRATRSSPAATRGAEASWLPGDRRRASASRRSRSTEPDGRWDADGDRGDGARRTAAATCSRARKSLRARRPRARTCSWSRRARGVARRGRASRSSRCPATRRASSGARSPTMDQTRRLAELALRRRARAGARRCSATEGAALAARSSDARPRRHRARRRAGGRRAALPRPRRRLREGARAVRPADRLASRRSSTSAPTCWCGSSRRARRATAPAASPRAGRRRARRVAASLAKAYCSDAYFQLRRRVPPDPRRRRLHLGVRRAPLLQARASRARRSSATPPATASASRRDRALGVMTERLDFDGTVVIVTGGGARRRPRHQPSAFSTPAPTSSICGRNAARERCRERGGAAPRSSRADVRELEQIDRVVDERRSSASAASTCS